MYYKFPTSISQYHNIDEIELTLEVRLELTPESRDPDADLYWEIKDITWERELFDDLTNESIDKYINDIETGRPLGMEIYERMHEELSYP
jgi:hypothetical protein